ncbi:hypothetical protein GCM10009616_37510 [Microlunatus lacustris]
MPPTSRAGRSIRWLLWPAAALVTFGLVGQASYSAFSSKTSNPGNNLAVGTVTLADDDAGAALLSLTNLKPGSSGSRCIAVTSTGSLASVVKLYTTDATVTRGLSSFVTLTVTQGTGGTFSSCTGFIPAPSGSGVYSGTLATLTSSATAYASGLGSWAPTGKATETRTFQVGYAVSGTTPDSAQGGSVTFDLVWEAQNS